VILEKNIEKRYFEINFKSKLMTANNSEILRYRLYQSSINGKPIVKKTSKREITFNLKDIADEDSIFIKLKDEDPHNQIALVNSFLIKHLIDKKYILN
jgi:protein-arginine kinase